MLLSPLPLPFILRPRTEMLVFFASSEFFSTGLSYKVSMFISSLMSFPLNKSFIYFQMSFQGFVIAPMTPLKLPLTSCQTAPIIVLNTNV